MEHENRKLDGDLRIEGAVEFSGSLSGSMTVAAGAELLLTGICVGDLVVEAGGRAVIHGTVGGDLLNRGAVELNGTVKGEVVTRDGRFERGPDAVVRGIVEE